MNFEHPEYRAMLVQSLERLLAERHAFEPREQMQRSVSGFSRELWNQLADLGVLSVLFPQDSGGLGGSGFDIMAVFETLGRSVMIEPVLGALMAGEALSASSDPQHRKVLAQLIEGGYIATLAHEETDFHHELSEVSTSARQIDGKWLLNGLKVSIPQGEQVDGFVVSAHTGRQPDAPSGISLFLVPATADGISVKGSPAIDGGRVADIDISNVVLEPGALIGPVGKGHAILQPLVERGILALCAESVGAMDTAKKHTLDYLRTRRQFGMAIGSFQALQHRMADILLEVEQARSAVINAAAAMDTPDAQVREQAISAAKFTIGRVGTLVAEECIQMHGGMGMTWDLELAHHAKRLIMIDHQLGDQDHHLQRYIETLITRSTSDHQSLATPATSRAALNPIFDLARS